MSHLVDTTDKVGFCHRSCWLWPGTFGQWCRNRLRRSRRKDCPNAGNGEQSSRVGQGFSSKKDFDQSQISRFYSMLALIRTKLTNLADLRVRLQWLLINDSWLLTMKTSDTFFKFYTELQNVLYSFFGISVISEQINTQEIFRIPT